MKPLYDIRYKGKYGIVELQKINSKEMDKHITKPKFTIIRKWNKKNE